MGKVRFDQDGEVGIITICDPPLNLFDLELIAELSTATVQAQDAPIRALLLRSRGRALHRRRAGPGGVREPHRSRRRGADRGVPRARAPHRETAVPDAGRRARTVPGRGPRDSAHARLDLGVRHRSVRVRRADHRADADHRRRLPARRARRHRPRDRDRAHRAPVPGGEVRRVGRRQPRAARRRARREGTRIRTPARRRPDACLRRHQAAAAHLPRARNGRAADAITARACARLFETDDLAHGIESLLSKGPGQVTFRGR